MAEPAYDDFEDEDPDIAAQQAADAAAEARLALERAIEGYVGELQTLADEQVSKKSLIEDRWYEDLRRYYGRYDGKTEANLKNENKSRIYVNWTRNKTHQWEARLSDMLFPTDDRNWGISPTPVPEISAKAQAAAFRARNLTDKANLEVKLGNRELAKQYAQEAQDSANDNLRTQAILDEAKKCAQAMQAEIDDQLTEAKYGIKCRRAIHDACVLGTGIVKGPLTAAKMRKTWRQRLDAENKPTNVYELQDTTTDKTEWLHVDPWNFFPDMSAKVPDEWEFTFERHLMTKKDMRKLARTEGFNHDNIAALLDAGPPDSLPPYVAMLRDITSQGAQGLEPRYIVWEYHGSIEAQKLMDISIAAGDEEMVNILKDERQPWAADPSHEIPVIIWFCNGKLLYYGPHPLESGETLYSLFNFHADESSVFGFGIPYLMQNAQAALNGAWRMILDHGAFASGPQIIIDREQLQPANGNYSVRGPKVWYLKKDLRESRGEPLRIVQVNNQQEKLEKIIEIAIRFADEEASMPLIAQGESSTHTTQTAQGMSILMNSANVVFRQVVRNFDDNMTVPNIRRAYDWNMQNSSKEHIKGDYQVDARGSSVLLVREIQSQNLMAMLDRYSVHPVLGRMTKIAQLYRKTVQSFMLPADEVVKTDEELEQQALEEANAPKQEDPEILKLQLQKEIAQMQDETTKFVAQMNRETALVNLAAKMNMDMKKLRAMLYDKQQDRQHKERIAATEIAVTDRRDRQAQAEGDKEMPKTAGGYV